MKVYNQQKYNRLNNNIKMYVFKKDYLKKYVIRAKSSREWKIIKIRIWVKRSTIDFRFIFKIN
jgi:hypothetical protein